MKSLNEFIKVFRWFSRIERVGYQLSQGRVVSGNDEQRYSLCTAPLNDYYLVYFNEMEILFLTGLSVDGDSQGVERLLGALSAHIWPGMILKSGDKITEPSLPEKEGFIHNVLLPYI